MSPDIVLKCEFVEYIPEELSDWTLYISMVYGTAVHKCCCGCGREVVTPLSPVAWKLTFDGESVSLYPSIGSWNLPCQSHYFISNNKVRWAPKWTNEQIAEGRAREAMAVEKHYTQSDGMEDESMSHTVGIEATMNLWGRIKRWLSRSSTKD